MEERFDLCDEFGRPLGRTKPRSLVHRDGDWHRSFHCWVFEPDPDSRDVRILLQLRPPDKDTCPGLWDVSVGGHYSAGEGLEGGLREISEELGLDAPASELVHAGWRRDVDRSPGWLDREVQDVYFLLRPLDLAGLKPDPAEVPALAIVPGRALLRLAAARTPSLQVPGGRVRPDRSVEPQPIALTPASLAPRQDRYYQRAVRFARRLADGHRPRRRRWWSPRGS